MAIESVVANAGSGGSSFATDQISGSVQVPYAKLMSGADASEELIGGDAANGLDVDVTRLPALPTGTNTIGGVNLTQYTPVSGRLPVDASGVAVPVTDNSASLTTDTPQLPATIGQKAMAASVSVAIASDQGNIGVTDGGTSLTVDSGQLPATLGQKAMAASMAVVLASDQASVPVAATLAAETTKVIGTVNVPADPFGVNADAASASGSISAKLRFIASTGIPVTGTVTVGSHAVTNAGTFAVQAGQAAHDAAVAGSPVRTAGRARTSDYTAVSADDTADVLTTVLGKQVVLPYALPGATWKYVGAAGGIVTTTAITIKAAGGAGVVNYITSILLVNSHQTIGTEVVINDGAAGTAIFRTWCQFAGGGCFMKCDPPLASSPNTLLEIKEITATGTAGVVAEIIGYSAAE